MKCKMNYNLKELIAELEDQKYEMYETFVIDFDDVITAIGNLEKELREILKFATMHKLPSDYPRDAKLIIKILGDENIT